MWEEPGTAPLLLALVPSLNDGVWKPISVGLLASPALPSILPEVIFPTAAAAQTPRNLYFEAGDFSLSGEGCQVIGPV